ncbi:MAG TPA: TatD family hydrolase [Spirochaetota bacterium]|nr:TatD family hydrolase [Spirochaetota bacterium]HSA16071.1 TatD family hydrolase [Spirochaetota bacterium]
MKLVDVHCHLESDEFADSLDLLLDRAERAGVVKLITCSIEPGQWPVSRELASKYGAVEFAWGIHPWYIREDDFGRIEELRHARDSGAVAIGEIGLDRKVAHPDFDTQLRFFEAQMKIAHDVNLPVIIHCRGAFNELALALKKTGVPEGGGVVHSFAGSMEVAAELARFNLSFSIGGILTYRNSRKRERMLKSIYPTRFLLETDSPDIPPVNAPSRINVPENITLNLAAAAEILGVPAEEVAKNTTANAVRIFGLKI